MKAVVATLEEVPEAIRGEYEPKNGKFQLKVEGELPGFVESTKLVEFRSKNVELLKELDGLRPLKDKFDGLDPTEAREAIEKVKKLEKSGIKNADDLDTRLATMLEQSLKPLRDKITESEAQTAAEKKRADEFLLHTKIGDAFVKAGGKANAIDFVTGLAKDSFEVKESKVVPKTGKFSTEKPGEPLTIEEWLTGSVEKDHDYVFTPSTGGGAANGPKGPGGAPGPVQLKEGQKLLKDPTPNQLGEFASEIATGKMKIVYSEVKA